MLVSSSAKKTPQHPTRMAGAFKDYLIALDSLREDLVVKEDEFKEILSAFYKITDGDATDDKYRDYLLSVNRSLDACNNVVSANNGNRPIIIDGQVPIARLVNMLKDCSVFIAEEILETVIDFWENIKYSLELVQILIDNLDRDVYSKLSIMYTGSPVMHTVDEVSSTEDQVKMFMTDISRFSKLLPENIMKCRLLIKSCGTHLRVALVDRSTIADKILVGVSTTQYPLLRIVPDLEFKLNDMIRICRKWIDREETFILNINDQIRQRRLLAKEKEKRILSAKDHQKSVLKSLKTSYILCQNSKTKMRDIVKELKLLEAHIRAVTIDHNQIGEEKYKTQTMAEFLNISISQTRKNYSLQMKRQRLETQVVELETTLVELDAEISKLKQEMILKSHEKMKTRDTLQVVEKTYLDAKNDLDSYAQSLSNYKAELISIRQSLNTMEGLKLLKSSPEYIENVFGQDEELQTQLVHLSPSLRNAISMKTQKINSIT